ncbi:MAG: hypothetical protein DRP56_07160, partial [Planctomycetota bacterium]
MDCPEGDLYPDCEINLLDLQIFAVQWLDGSGTADFDGQNGVNNADFVVLAQDWGEKRIALSLNEFMASNNNFLLDGSGESSDWIEIHNAPSAPIDMEGYYLTDDPCELTKWQFPADVTIDAGCFLIVFASGKNQVDYPVNYPYLDPGDYYHTNFKLSAGGEYLALVEPDGQTIAHEYNGYEFDDGKFGFPPQETNVSYGLYGQQIRYFGFPTPGLPNNDGYIEIVGDTSFSHDRGFYDAPFDVVMACETEGATIHYTLNGSEPTETDPCFVATPVTIATTTCLRAKAFKPGWMPSNSDTQTYIFLTDVIEQPTNPTGFPSSWDGVTTDYEMDPDVVDAAAYSGGIIDDLKSIPTMSLVLDVDDLFGETDGIYANPLNDGVEWERPSSIELIYPDGSEGFQVNAGVRILGAHGRRPEHKKHSFRLLFKGEYGPTKLSYPLFGDDAADEFDTIVLRASGNDSWHVLNENAPFHTCANAQFIRDEWMRSSQIAMGHVGSHGTFVHLYVNGLYWGLYNPLERPAASFAASYYGGDKDEYDAIKISLPSREAVDGDLNAWETAHDIANAGVSDQTGYEALAEYVDIINLTDYFLLYVYTGEGDWDNNNWYAARRRVDGETFKFFVWDAEFTNLRVDGLNMVNTNYADCPSRLFQQLRANPEFRLLAADRVHKHMFNDGALTSASNLARYQQLADTIYQAIVGESARWGDHGGGSPYTRDDHWIPERDRILNSHFPARLENVLGYLRGGNLYPYLDAPIFFIDNQYQHGGSVATGAALSMANGGSSMVTIVPEGADWRYLDDGSDQGTAWRYDAPYDDSAWAVGPAELGYGDGDEATVVSDGGNPSYKHVTTYFRHHFTVSDVSNYEGLTVKLFRDDGGVIYLNGAEILPRSNMPSGEILYDTFADSVVPEAAWFEYEVDASLLNEGDNLIAVEIHQVSRTSSDVSFNLSLTGDLIVPILGGNTIYYTLDGTDPRQAWTGAVIGTEYTSPITLTESVRVKARAKDGSTWSALNEAVYSVGPVAQNLRITEIMYHPQDVPDGDPNAEFIELKNIGAEIINLNLVSFTNGIDFTFGDTDLAAGDYVVVVREQSTFDLQYPTFSGTIAGEYTGSSLDNGGERIELQDAIGQTIQDFKYKDGWRDITDGQGYSLRINDPTNTDPNTWGYKTSWGASPYLLGSP